MRKVIGILLMVVVVSGFIMASVWRWSDKTPTDEIAQDNKVLKIEEQIDLEYPTRPSEVIAKHNDLMKILYGNISTKDTIEDYVRTIRKLYSTELLSINSEEVQLEELKSEQEVNNNSQLVLIGSEIQETYVHTDEDGEETTAEVFVKHTTNLGSLMRSYSLVKEDGKWKINKWETEKNVQSAEPE